MVVRFTLALGWFAAVVGGLRSPLRDPFLVEFSESALFTLRIGGCFRDEFAVLLHPVGWFEEAV